MKLGSPYRMSARGEPEKKAARGRWACGGQDVFIAVVLLLPVVVGIACHRFGGLETVCLVLALLVLREALRELRARSRDDEGAGTGRD